MIPKNKKVYRLIRLTATSMLLATNLISVQNVFAEPITETSSEESKITTESDEIINEAAESAAETAETVEAPAEEAEVSESEAEEVQAEPAEIVAAVEEAPVEAEVQAVQETISGFSGEQARELNNLQSVDLAATNDEALATDVVPLEFIQALLDAKYSIYELGGLWNPSSDNPAELKAADLKKIKELNLSGVSYTANVLINNWKNLSILRLGIGGVPEVIEVINFSGDTLDFGHTLEKSALKSLTLRGITKLKKPLELNVAPTDYLGIQGVLVSELKIGDTKKIELSIAKSQAVDGAMTGSMVELAGNCEEFVAFDSAIAQLKLDGNISQSLGVFGIAKTISNNDEFIEGTDLLINGSCNDVAINGEGGDESAIATLTITGQVEGDFLADKIGKTRTTGGDFTAGTAVIISGSCNNMDFSNSAIANLDVTGTIKKRLYLNYVGETYFSGGSPRVGGNINLAQAATCGEIYVDNSAIDTLTLEGTVKKGATIRQSAGGYSTDGSIASGINVSINSAATVKKLSISESTLLSLNLEGTLKNLYLEGVAARDDENNPKPFTFAISAGATIETVEIIDTFIGTLTVNGTVSKLLRLRRISETDSAELVLGTACNVKALEVEESTIKNFNLKGTIGSVYLNQVTSVSAGGNEEALTFTTAETAAIQKITVENSWVATVNLTGEVGEVHLNNVSKKYANTSDITEITFSASGKIKVLDVQNTDLKDFEIKGSIETLILDSVASRATVGGPIQPFEITTTAETGLKYVELNQVQASILDLSGSAGTLEEIYLWSVNAASSDHGGVEDLTPVDLKLTSTTNPTCSKMKNLTIANTGLKELDLKGTQGTVELDTIYSYTTDGQLLPLTITAEDSQIKHFTLKTSYNYNGPINGNGYYNFYALVDSVNLDGAKETLETVTIEGIKSITLIDGNVMGDDAPSNVMLTSSGTCSVLKDLTVRQSNIDQLDISGAQGDVSLMDLVKRVGTNPPGAVTFTLNRGSDIKNLEIDSGNYEELDVSHAAGNVTLRNLTYGVTNTSATTRVLAKENAEPINLVISTCDLKEIDQTGFTGDLDLYQVRGGRSTSNYYQATGTKIIFANSKLKNVKMYRSSILDVEFDETAKTVEVVELEDVATAYREYYFGEVTDTSGNPLSFDATNSEGESVRYQNLKKINLDFTQDGRLDKFNLPSCKKLEEVRLNLYDTNLPLTKLNLANSGVKVFELDRSVDSLNEIDLSNNKLQEVSFPESSYSKIEKLNFNNNPSFKFRGFEFGKFSNLLELRAFNIGLDVLDIVGALPRLRILNCGGNNLTELDLGGERSKLEELDVSKNQLTKIDTTHAISLRELNISYNKFKTKRGDTDEQIKAVINLGAGATINSLFAGYNQFANITFAKNIAQYDFSNQTIYDVAAPIVDDSGISTDIEALKTAFDNPEFQITNTSGENTKVPTQTDSLGFEINVTDNDLFKLKNVVANSDLTSKAIKFESQHGTEEGKQFSGTINFGVETSAALTLKPEKIAVKNGDTAVKWTAKIQNTTPDAAITDLKVNLRKLFETDSTVKYTEGSSVLVNGEEMTGQAAVNILANVTEFELAVGEELIIEFQTTVTGEINQNQVLGIRTSWTNPTAGTQHAESSVRIADEELNYGETDGTSGIEILASPIKFDFGDAEVSPNDWSRASLDPTKYQSNTKVKDDGFSLLVHGGSQVTDGWVLSAEASTFRDSEGNQMANTE